MNQFMNKGEEWKEGRMDGRENLGRGKLDVQFVEVDPVVVQTTSLTTTSWSLPVTDCGRRNDNDGGGQRKSDRGMR